MAGSAKKATKKFEKNHLKDTIEKRKEFAKIKQRQQIKAKKQARNAADKLRAPELEEEHVASKARANGSKATNDLSKMTVDEFFQGGIDLPEKSATKSSQRKSKKETPALGKRKRDEEDKASVAVDDAMSNASSAANENSEGDDELGVHKGDLEALAEKDPEFFKYLKENDAELLDFDENAEFPEIDQLSEEEESRPKKKSKKGNAEDEEPPQTEEGDEVTMAMVDKWKKSMVETHSLRAMRQTVLAFRAASYADADGEKSHKYTIGSAEVYHALLVTALEHIPTVLAHHLPPKELPSGKVRIATDSKKFRALSPLLRSYSTSIHHLLETLSDPPTIKMTLNALHPLLPYLLSFKKLLQQLTTIVVTLWASTTATSSEATLITAFLVIRRLFTLADAGLRTAILKMVYLHLIKASRTTNTHTLPLINLLKNSAAELWGMDPTTGYTTGFTSVRQLAIHLRSSITKPTKESYKTIYNWQYVHSLDFWARVLSSHCSPASNPHLKRPQDSPLHPLIYPLVQITLGALRLIPTPAYFPLRFHLTRSLLRISRTTTTYIPLAPSLLEVLQSPDISKAPKASTLAPLDFTTCLKAPKAYLRTRPYQDGVGQEVHELLAEFFTCWARNIAFPELTVPPTVALKRWLKLTASTTNHPRPSGPPQQQQKSRSNPRGRGGGGSNRGSSNRNGKLHALFTLLLQKLQQQARYIEAARAKVTFSPSQRAEVEGFLREVEVGQMPLGAYVEGLRAVKEEREKVLASAKREEGGKGRRRGEEDEDEDGDRNGVVDGGFGEEEDDDDDEEEEEE